MADVTVIFINFNTKEMVLRAVERARASAQKPPTPPTPKRATEAWKSRSWGPSPRSMREREN